MLLFVTKPAGLFPTHSWFGVGVLSISSIRHEAEERTLAVVNEREKASLKPSVSAPSTWHVTKMRPC